jgi:hypothetical protein
MKTRTAVTPKVHQSMLRNIAGERGAPGVGGFFSETLGAGCFFSSGAGGTAAFAGSGFGFSRLMNHWIKLLVLNDKKEVIPDEDAEREFIVAKLSRGTRFRSQVSGEVKYDAAVWLLRATTASIPLAPEADKYIELKLRLVKLTADNRRIPVRGAKYLQDSCHGASCSATTWPANSFDLSFAEGPRGIQERNCLSNGFGSLISLSFQTSPHFLQAITITTSGCIGRQFQ